MKIPVLCNTCVSDDMMGDHDYLLVEPRSDGIYKTTCPRGHTVTRLLDEEHFEVLFEYGVHALRDGYMREAVSSFAAALERFHEYAIKIIVSESHAEDEQARAAWAQVKKQSERQAGAFIYLFLARLGTVPEMPTNNEAQFRNNVIHNGHFPTFDESTNYGEQVRQLILDNHKTLRSVFGDTIHAEKTKRQRAYLATLAADEMPVYFGIAKALNVRTAATPLSLKGLAKS